MLLECPNCHQYIKVDPIDDTDRINFGNDLITSDEKDRVIGHTQYCEGCRSKLMLVAVKESLIKVAAFKI